MGVTPAGPDPAGEPRPPAWIPGSVLTRPRAWLLAIMVLTLPFAVALPRLRIRTDGEALHPHRDPVIEATRAERERFRDPEAVIVLVAARGGGGVFTPEGLALVRALTERLRAVPGVRSDDVASLATALDVTASAEKIRLTTFLDPLPASPAEIAELRRRLAAGGIYEGLLYGADGRSAAIHVPLVADAARVEVVHRVRATVDAAAAAGFDVRLTGPVVAEAFLGEQILADLERLVPLVVGVVAVALALCLGTAAGALAPLLAMLFVLCWTGGTMAMLGVPLTLVTSVLPVLLMAMAVTDQIHLLERFQSHHGAGEARRAALARALAEVGPPIVRTSVTTALAFLSFTITSVLPMRDFGYFAGLGLLLAMAFSFTLVPAALMLLPESWLRRRRPRGAGAPGGLEGWAGRRPRRGAAVAVGLAAVAVAGLPALEVQDSWVENFSPRSDLAVAERVFNREYLGSYRLDVTLESDAVGAFRGPEGFRRLDSLQAALAALPDVGGTRSLVDLARAALRGVDPDRAVETLDDAGLAQLLLLVEMSGGLDAMNRLIDPAGRAARVQCFVRGADYAKAKRLLAGVAEIGESLERETGLRLRVTGDLPVATQVVRATVENQVRSVGFTLIGLGVFLALSFRSLAVAGALLLPVAATTLVVFGGMGFFAIPLGVATSMFAALAEGEGVDFSVHIASRFLHLRGARPPEEALRETLGSVGLAVRWNGIALIAGCLVLGLSALRPVRALGLLLAAGMAVSYLLAFLALPVLLLRLRPPRAAAPGSARAATPGRLGLPALLVVLAALVPAAALAQERAPDDVRARRLMAAIERSQRAAARIFSLDITLALSGSYETTRRMLGVTHDDRRTTRILYVITAPRLFRGATLLIHDARDPRTLDRMWLALPGVAGLREIVASSLRYPVPGTGLTYEDARGFIAADKYRFALLAEEPERLTIEARPATDSLARALGVSRLVVRADPVRKVVLGVVTHDEAGNLVRTYDATDFVRVQGRWYPARVEVDQRAQQLRASITYTYAALGTAPPAELFRPEPGDATLLSRLLAWTGRAGHEAAFPDTLARGE